jgi:hypothetical protein
VWSIATKPGCGGKCCAETYVGAYGWGEVEDIFFSGCEMNLLRKSQILTKGKYRGDTLPNRKVQLFYWWITISVLVISINELVDKESIMYVRWVSNIDNKLLLVMLPVLTSSNLGGIFLNKKDSKKSASFEITILSSFTEKSFIKPSVVLFLSGSSSV